MNPSQKQQSIEDELERWLNEQIPTSAPSAASAASTAPPTMPNPPLAPAPAQNLASLSQSLLQSTLQSLTPSQLQALLSASSQSNLGASLPQNTLPSNALSASSSSLPPNTLPLNTMPPNQLLQNPGTVPRMSSGQAVLMALPPKERDQALKCIHAARAGQISLEFMCQKLKSFLNEDAYVAVIQSLNVRAFPKPPMANPGMMQQPQQPQQPTKPFPHPQSNASSSFSQPLQEAMMMKRQQSMEGTLSTDAGSSKKAKTDAGSSSTTGAPPATGRGRGRAKQQPGMKQGQSVGAIGMPSAAGTDTAKNVDVTKMDSSSLQDVIQYAGVDLKEESELILRDAESRPRRGTHSAGRQPYQDETRAQKWVVPMVPLQVALRRLVHAQGLRAVESDVEVYLAMALQERLRTLLEGAVQASRARLDVGRDAWNLSLVDGEGALVHGGEEGGRSRVGAVKRPLVWLERFEKEREARYAIRVLQCSVSDEGRLALLDSGQMDVEAMEEAVKGGKKAKAKLDERDEEVIRTRLANATAMKAAGFGTSSKYSWMTDAGGSAGASTAATTGAAGDASQKPTTGAGSREAPSSFGAFALPRPDARAKMLAQRTVTVQDLMVALRFDRSRAGWGRMRRSRVVARTFGLRFRE